MIHTTMPASVNVLRPTIAAAARKKTGLLPMQIGSSHAIHVEIDGREKTIYCQARSSEDFPGAEAYFFCMHDRCAGKKWGSIDAMRTDHPQKTAMDKTGDAHVYGAWSDDAFAEEDRDAAEAKHKAAEAKHAACEAAVEAAKDIGQLEVAKDRKRDAFAVLLEAQKALAAVSGCIGLIAPPDAMGGT